MTRDTDIVGKEFRGCRVLRRLGAGGMGAVFLARHKTLQRDVAIKFLSDELVNDDVAIARFLREARTLAQIEDAVNIVKVYDCGVEQGRHFIMLQFVQGSDLGSYVERHGGRLEPQEAKGIILQTLRGLKCAHDIGVVHRDIKPANILVSDDGVAKLSDFGLVRRTRDDDTGLTSSGNALGTPLFMSPEQWRGDSLDERTDIYSLGATFYHLLTGAYPYQAKTTGELAVQVLAGRCTPLERALPGVDRRLAAIVTRMMSPHREQRYPDAGGVIQALEELESPKSSVARSGQAAGAHAARSSTEHDARLAATLLRRTGSRAPRDDGAESSEPPRRVPALAIVLAATGVLAVAGFLVSGWNKDAAPAPTPRAATPSGKLLILVHPRTAEVLVDQKPLAVGRDGTLSADSLPVGEHEVAVRLKGVEPVTKRATIADGETCRIEVRLDLPGMVYVPAGRLKRGLAPDEAQRIAQQFMKDHPEVTVEVDALLAEKTEVVDVPGFYLDRCEVSNKEFQKFVQEGGGRAPTHWNGRACPSGTANRPVVGVNWEDARAYATWAGKRLMTEVEFERAVRGDNDWYYPWGNVFESTRCDTRETPNLPDVAVTEFENGKSAHGALNLVGNVSEWTADAADPSEGSRLVKGGSFNDWGAILGLFCFQVKASPDVERSYIGFRCARDGE